MGLSSKQVSSDGHGWNQALMQADTLELPKAPAIKKQSSSSSQQQQQQQQPEHLKCPRCDSTNTKFCYYNNYNKSQPRHFCKACKRHWTKGGTLRNVPVGGGRKNKRKTSSNSASKAASKTTTTTTTTTTFSTIGNNINMGTLQSQQPRLTLPFDEKNLTEAFYQTLGRQPPCSLPEPSMTFSNKGFFLGSSLSLPEDDQDLQFPYSNLGTSFESNPCSISSTISSTQSPNVYSYNTGEGNPFEEKVMNNLSATTTAMSDHQQTWAMPDMSSNWGWDDFDKFVSVDADLTIPWDDSEIKP